MRDDSNCVNAVKDKGFTASISPAISIGRKSENSVKPDFLQGIRVMVVDDDSEIAEELAEALEFAGATSVWVSDPLCAREILSGSAENWSVLVTDLEMPACSGSELAAFSASLTTPVPVILMTGTNNVEQFKSSRLFYTVLQKPVCAHQLALILQEVKEKFYISRD